MLEMNVKIEGTIYSLPKYVSFCEHTGYFAFQVQIEPCVISKALGTNFLNIRIKTLDVLDSGFIWQGLGFECSDCICIGDTVKFEGLVLDDFDSFFIHCEHIEVMS